MTHKYVVRAAERRDVRDILLIVNPLARIDLLLPRSPKNISRCLPGFTVVERGGRVVACAELRILSPGRMAEILSLGVKKGFEGHGYEIPLLAAIVKEARRLRIEKVFTVSHLIEVLGKAGFVIPDSGERNILFFYSRKTSVPKVTGGDERVEIRTARFEEISTVLKMIEEQANGGHLLHRTWGELERLVLAGCSFVATVDDRAVGHACLDIYNPDQAELRSLVVRQNFSGRRVASRLIERVCREAWCRNISELMTVTSKVELFLAMGFAFTSRYLTEARWVYPQTWKLP